MWNMILFRFRTVLVLFILIAYLITPLIDSAVCEDCVNFTKSAATQSGLPGTDTPSLREGGTSPDDSSERQTTVKDLCQVCFDAAKIVRRQNSDIVLSSVTFEPYAPLLNTPILAFSVNEPPEV
jgi:hypothetical protein